MAKKNDKISFSGRFQHKYLKNFVKDDKGEWVYTGDHYRYTNKDIPEKKMHKHLLLLSLAGVTGAAGGGLIKAPGTIDAWYIILPQCFRHIIPNCISPVIVQASMDIGGVILTVASLSFLGLGAQHPGQK